MPITFVNESAARLDGLVQKREAGESRVAFSRFPLLSWRLVMAVIAMMAATQMMAQQTREWEEDLRQLILTEAVENGTEERDIEEWYDQLCELERNPININSATKETLEQLPFLNDKQIEEIMAYRYHYGPLCSKGELMMIASLDYFERRMLTHFVCIGEAEKPKTTTKEWLSKGQIQVVTALQCPLYRRKGDDNGYQGYPYKHWTRLEWKQGQQVKAGIMASQDAGEPFFAGANSKGFDYYSPYLQINGWGPWKTLVAGRFKAAYAQGLVLGSSFSLGKMAALAAMGRRQEGLKAHASRSEADYFQGVGATWKWRNQLLLTLFLSHRSLDATLNDDGTAATIVSSGYHRTQQEMAKKANTKASSIGANWQWNGKGWTLGMTALYTSLNRPLNPDKSQIYRMIYPSGKDFFNLSASYGIRKRKFSLVGETAIDRKGAVSSVQSVNCSVAGRVELLLIQRFYSYRYESLSAHAFGSGSRTQNESGLYLGVVCPLDSRWKLQGYLDWAYYPWPRYQTTRSSYAFDAMSQIVFDSDRYDGLVSVRTRMQQKKNGADMDMQSLWSSVMKLNLARNMEGGWRVGGMSQVVCAHTQREYGGSVALQLEKKWRNNTLMASIAYFNTSDNASRLYTYERGLSYSFSCPSFDGKGLRYYLLARLKRHRGLQMTLKWGVTNYFDRTRIGDSYQTIYGSSKSDLECQVDWKW